MTVLPSAPSGATTRVVNGWWAAKYMLSTRGLVVPSAYTVRYPARVAPLTVTLRRTDLILLDGRWPVPGSASRRDRPAPSRDPPRPRAVSRTRPGSVAANAPAERPVDPKYLPTWSTTTVAGAAETLVMSIRSSLNGTVTAFTTVRPAT